MTGRVRRIGVNSILNAGPGIYKVFIIYLVITAVLRVLSARLATPVLNWMQDCYEFLANGNIEFPLAPEGSGLAMLLVLIMALMCRTVEVGWLRSALSISRGSEFSFHDLSASFSYFWKVWILHIIQSFAFSAALTLFVFPAVWLFYRWRFAYYILADNPKLGPVKCLRLSAELTNGHKREIFEIDLSFFASYLLALAARVLTSGVVELFKMPAIAVTMACYYNIRVGVHMPAEKMPPPPGYPEEYFGGGDDGDDNGGDDNGGDGDE